MTPMQKAILWSIVFVVPFLVAVNLVAAYLGEPRSVWAVETVKRLFN